MKPQSQIRNKSLGGVKLSEAERSKSKYRWRKERDKKETYSAWVRRNIT